MLQPVGELRVEPCGGERHREGDEGRSRRRIREAAEEGSPLERDTQGGGDSHVLLDAADDGAEGAVAAKELAAAAAAEGLAPVALENEDARTAARR